MKIGSHIKPRSGKPRVVTIHERPYVFAPVLDKDELQHFVAEVKNEEHAAVLLQSGHFYRYGEELQPKPTLKPPVAADPVKPPESPAFGNDVQAEAAALLAQSVAKIGVALGQVSTLDVIRAAIDLEKASDTSRDSALKLLNAALEGAIAAGVKG